jgi:hypothetical protein
LEAFAENAKHNGLVVLHVIQAELNDPIPFRRRDVRDGLPQIGLKGTNPAESIAEHIAVMAAERRHPRRFRLVRWQRSEAEEVGHPAG